MDLPLTRTVAPLLTWLPEVDSTNAWLSQRVREAHPDSPVPDRFVVATDTQTSGRGRLDRAWTAPARTSLAVSALRRARRADAALALLPLTAGSAVAAALRPLLPSHSVTVKWPNDVHVDGLKVCGILCELTADGGVIIGVGINLTLTAAELPVPTATSLALQDAVSTSVDTVLSATLSELWAQTTELLDADTPQRIEAIVDRARRDSATLGRRVSTHLPDGSVITGVARTLDTGGRLVIERADGGGMLTVSAGDVIHLR
ncbi:biotin--[acetyl-CoA-carboxylase] ligase [Klugiella xanthotipulae]|uniref:biotin--[biotin carboxyl-carrier protein] ligase n=1 Tax=Klugiella xanthotipulae TaxID=244735 RepID=A0A543HYM5_9MICO|nr:biotin--[acetyl-CoA-carboxylase] ligase [Klugiella xanthotipulae]TQM63419.1 BirA family biotin operon repressor/biotin-[acetyl-CoA-carboxylase] ligase [Klugiella xanthotipulae]